MPDAAQTGAGGDSGAVARPHVQADTIGPHLHLTPYGGRAMKTVEPVVPPVSRDEIEAFLAQPALAVVGASRRRRKFGNVAYRELRSRGRRVYAVHPTAKRIEGDPAFGSFYELPEPVAGVLVVVPPEETERVVHDAAEAGIGRVWMQQGAQSLAAIHFCAERGIQVIHGQCILMFLEPAAFIHRAHRWFRGRAGRLPQ